MFCPGWMFDVASARVAREYLAAEIPMETFGEKYAKYLSETYSDVSVDQLTGCAMAILEFLSEIEAGEMSVELIDHYCHDRLHFEKVGVPRRMKSMFGNVEDGVKSARIQSGAPAEILPDLCVPASERPDKHVTAGLASRGRRQYPEICRGRRVRKFRSSTAFDSLAVRPAMWILLVHAFQPSIIASSESPVRLRLANATSMAVKRLVYSSRIFSI